MDRFRGRIGRRPAEKKEEVPKIVIDSPPEEINVPYADSATPSTSSCEGTAPIAVPEEPTIEIVVEGSDDAKENKGKDVEISKPESADPAGENAKLLDDDDDDDESDKKQRRASLRRNSISLPNLDSLELQDIKDQHARRVKGVSVFDICARIVAQSIFLLRNGVCEFQICVANQLARLLFDANQIIYHRNHGIIS